ncbi:MAG: DUF4468 domain-containing protein [Bacteroidaceae bacterium]|nr:DUF4468 domain-containing protein [Bacteroidaceae bacterium]
MNKLFITLCAALLPLCANAQVDELFQEAKPKGKETVTIEEMKRNLYGNIPTENGKIVLRYTCETPNMTKDEAYALLGYWAEKRFQADLKRAEWGEKNFFHNLPYAAVKMASKKDGNIKCQGAEELIVTNKTFVKNWSEFYYTLNISVTDNRIDAVVTNLYYITDAEGDRAKLTGEEFISNEAIQNGKGRFVRNATKYRKETIDLFKSLFSEIKVVASSKKK